MSDGALSPQLQGGSGRAPGEVPAVVGYGTRIVVELDRAQVDQVIRAASAAGTAPVSTNGLGDLNEALLRGLDAGKPDLDGRRLSRSLLAGLAVLAALPDDGSYVGISEMARKMSMTNSMVHRYVSTLVAAGLAERNARTRKYRRSSLDGAGGEGTGAGAG